MSDLDLQAIQERAADIIVLQSFLEAVQKREHVNQAHIAHAQASLAALLADRAEREQELAVSDESVQVIASHLASTAEALRAAEADREALREALASGAAVQWPSSLGGATAPVVEPREAFHDMRKDDFEREHMKDDSLGTSRARRGGGETNG